MAGFVRPFDWLSMKDSPSDQLTMWCYTPDLTSLQAKERSIESLRDTLATTKRTYEGRLSQAEAALAVRDAEVGFSPESGCWGPR